MPDPQMRLFAFRIFGPSQNWSGLWSHPNDQGRNYNDLTPWVELAKLAERGLLDGIFFADSTGFNNVYGGNVNEIVRAGGMAPINDPMVLVSALAYATSNLCFGITGNLSNEYPYLLARRLSTLDHLTKGRLAWNIVTGVANSSSKAMRASGLRAHDDRYDYADEVMDVVYKLWEKSWEDGAVRRDAANHIYADPTRVHEISHSGRELEVVGTHMCEPSPQRTPVLFQAGGSARGRAFAAAHAECVFLTGPVEQMQKRVRDIRRLAEARGRDPGKILMIGGATVIVGRTDAEAQEKYEAYRRYVDVRGTLAIQAGHIGIDLSQYGLDDTIEDIKSDSIQSVADTLNALSKTRKWKIRDLAEFGPQPAGSLFVCGSPTTVADTLMAAMTAGDLDGFNLFRTVEPEGLADFIDLVVPELQRRGAYKTAYAPGAMRNKLYGDGDRLDSSHPAIAGMDEETSDEGAAAGLGPLKADA